MTDLLHTRVSDLLDEFASEAPTPGSGAAAAITAALAASLVTMAARATPGWDGSRGAAAQGNALRRRVAPLADADAYAESLAALSLPDRLEPEVRDMAIRDTLARAAAVPLAIAEASADVALLAVDVAEHCEPGLRADAVAAAQLAQGAARAAAELVAVNLGMAAGDERLELAHRMVRSAADAASRIGVLDGSGPSFQEMTDDVSHTKPGEALSTCSSCGFENAAGARFCGQCGTPLERRCTTCDEPVAPGLAFCTSCGTRVAAPPAAPEPPSQPEPELLSGEERKIVTVLFADLVRFTSQSEQLDPEDVRRMLGPYYTRLRSELERHGGTVEKFIGDAVMALFGAPLAHEDDPERAVRAAFAIRDAMSDISGGDGRRLHLRIGVTTGEALISLGARMSEGEGMAAGDVVNTAARLQSNAPVDGILVDESTYRSTRAVIDYREGEPVQAKGKSQPISVWEALEPRSRLGVDVAARSGAPLVGRTKEVQILLDALGRARREPQAELVTLVGVPGIGKSRLTAELAAAADDEPELIFWRQGRSLPYGEGVTYWALGEMIKAQAGILETDAAETAEEKLAATVSELIPDVSVAFWVESHLRPLVGLTGEETSGDRRGEEFAAWRRFFEALAERGTLVLVFEDLHWADSGLLDFVEYLVDWAGSVPLLVVCTARPELLERRPGWGGGKRNAATISLSPLTGDDTEQLIASLLERAVLPAETQAALLARSGGNPLYAEEYVRMLQDRGFLRRREGGGWELDQDELPMPESVQAIVAARLDALSPGEKALLQDAAVAGKVVWVGALVAISGDARPTVDDRLHALERKEFVRRERRSSVGTETQYAFSHVLVRDVAYNQIPRGRRAEKHRLVAEWIESLAAGRSEDLAEMLAHHYLSALDYARAAGQQTGSLARRARLALREAGDRAHSLSAFETAKRFYGAALDLWPLEDPDHPDVLLRYGRARFDADGAGAEVLVQARDVLLAQGRREPAAEAEVVLASIAWIAGDHDRAFEHLESARELVETAAPSRAKAEVLSHHSRYLMLAEHDLEAIEVARAALNMAEALGLDELRAHALNNLGSARANAGDETGLRDLERCIAIASEHNSPEAIRGYINLANQHEIAGDLRTAWELQDKGRQMAQRLNQAPTGRFLKLVQVAENYYRGRWSEALELANAEITESEDETPHYLESDLLMMRGRIRLARGDGQAAVDDAERSLTRARIAKDPQILFPAIAFAAETALAQGNSERAGSLADELLAALVGEATGMWSYVTLAWVLLDLGREQDLLPVMAVQNPGRWVDAATAIAQVDLTAAARLFAEIGSRPDEARAHMYAGSRLVREGRRSVARPELEAALAFYREVGAVACMHEAEALLPAAV